MSLTRRYKLVFTREVITDEGVVIKELPQVIGQVCQSEREFMYLNETLGEKTISKTALQRLYECLQNELDNPNSCLKPTKDIKNDIIDIDENTQIEPEIIPLHPGRE